MSTSVLYRALGVRGYVHRSIRQQHGGINIRMRHDGTNLRCPQCSGQNIIRRGTVSKCWSAPPIGSKTVTLFADVPRLECSRRPSIAISVDLGLNRTTTGFENGLH